MNREKTLKRRKLEEYLTLGLKQSDAAKLTGVTRAYAGLVAHSLGIKPVFKKRAKIPCAEPGCKNLLNPASRRVTGKCWEHCFGDTKAKFIRQLGMEKLGVAEIGQIVGVTPMYAWNILNRSGLKLPKRTIRKCSRCSVEFTKPRSSPRRICGECR